MNARLMRRIQLALALRKSCIVATVRRHGPEGWVVSSCHPSPARNPAAREPYGG
jgi:hypothetical protein